MSEKSDFWAGVYRERRRAASERIERRVMDRMKWGPLREGLARLLPARQPDHGDHDARAIDRQHDHGRRLNRRRGVERDFGEVERPDHRDQEHESDRKDDRDDV